MRQHRHVHKRLPDIPGEVVPDLISMEDTMPYLQLASDVRWRRQSLEEFRIDLKMQSVVA